MEAYNGERSSYEITGLEAGGVYRVSVSSSFGALTSDRSDYALITTKHGNNPSEVIYVTANPTPSISLKTQGLELLSVAA